MDRSLFLTAALLAVTACGGTSSRDAGTDLGTHDAGTSMDASHDGSADLGTDLGASMDMGLGERGIPVCFGTPTDCAMRDTTTCAMGYGCTQTHCTGTPVQCASLTTGADCNMQSGCAWGGTCIGTAAACAHLFVMDTCGRQMGCTWDTTTAGACGGIAVPCSSLDTTMCTMQPGCSTTIP